MSVNQNKINGVEQTLAQALVGSFSILSAGLDQNANTTLNNVEVQNYPEGGNIMVGESAMSSSLNNPLTNIAIGYNALPAVDGSLLNSDNISIGQNSLVNVTTGGKNIGIGLNALEELSTESYTIGIGNNTKALTSNGIIIGNNAKVINPNSGIIKFDPVTTNTTYPASNEFWFGDSSTGWIDVKAGDVYVDNLDVSGALSTSTLSLNSLKVISDTGYINVVVRNSGYTNSLNKIDEIKNTATFRNKYGPIAFIADVSGVSTTVTDPITREKILFGYQQGTKAIEINSYGAISLDSFNNSGIGAETSLTSNFGTSGQILSSQGSSLNPKWSTITDLSGVISLNNKNIGGITFVKDLSGNLDSSSNFIYDGSGINIVSSKNSQLNGLQIQNINTGGSAASDIVLKNSSNTSTLELKSTGYTAGTTIDASRNMLTLTNTGGSISTNSSDRTLFGYSSNTKAIEIASTGAMSFDTSNNSGVYVSNYGTSGQILSSQGSSLNPKWSTITDLSGVISLNNKNIGGITFVKDSSGNLDSSSNFIYDGSGINIVSSKNSQLNGLQIQNINTGGSATSAIVLKNSSNTSTLELKSTGYTAGTTIDASRNMLTLTNNSGSISTNSSDRTLFGYSSNTKAIEIASTGAMSFDTSNNSGVYVSNYGTSGQILSSQGSSLPPKWIANSGGVSVNVPAQSILFSSSGTDISGSSLLTFEPSLYKLNVLANITGGLPNVTPTYTTPLLIAHSQPVSNQIILQSTANVNTTKAKYLLLDSSGNDTTKYYGLELNSSIYQQTTNKITELQLGGNIVNKQGPIIVAPNNSGILLGYNSDSKAIQINSSGALSFDTSGNGDYPLTLTSNYGVSGEVLVSQGSNAPPKWINTYQLINAGSSSYTSDMSGNPLTLITTIPFTDLIANRKRVVTFSTNIITDSYGGFVYYNLYVNSVLKSTIKYVVDPFNKYFHSMIFNYVDSGTSDTMYITASGVDIGIVNTTSYSFRFELM